MRAALVEMLPRLRRFALARTGSWADADDLLQTALERALSRLHTWERGTRLDSWMFRIMQNVRIDQLRAERARPREVPLTESAEPIAGAQADAPHARELETVLAAMQRLSDDHRAVLMLVCVEGMRYREAAEIMGVSIGTVMSRLSRARKQLHRLLAKTGARAAGDTR